MPVQNKAMETKNAADRGVELSDWALVPLHISDAEELLGISRHTLQAEIRAGRLSACRVRGRWYVTRAQIAAWEKRIEVAAHDS